MEITLNQTDCLKAMKELPDNSIDMILCDLPYGTTTCKWDVIIPFEPLWEQYERIIKSNGAIVLTASQPFTTDLINSNRKDFKYEWIWEKNFSGGFVLAKKRPMKYHENVLIFYKQQPTYNPLFEEYSDTTKDRYKNSGKGNNLKSQKAKLINEIQGIKIVQNEVKLERGTYPKSVQKIKGVPTCNGGRVHPTQKPVALMEYLIKTYTNEGETVLDNCMGSGTTGVACVNLNRNFIGYELDSDYFQIAQKRIENAKNKIEECLI